MALVKQQKDDNRNVIVKQEKDDNGNIIYEEYDDGYYEMNTYNSENKLIKSLDLKKNGCIEKIEVEQYSNK